jgi:glyoxylase-like metal-dependent hydrolase (beta-lactamase superfamily II)
LSFPLSRALAALTLAASFACVAPAEPHWSDALPRAAWAELERVPSVDDWFEVHRLPHDVYAIYEPHQFQEVISYLILGSERALLFDTGMGLGDLEGVVAGLTDLPVTVLNSHGHFDHVGGNAEFETVLALDTPYTREAARGLPHEAVAAEVAPDALTRPLPEGVDAATWCIRPWDVSGHVEDGTHIDLGGRVLQVLVIPGHTPDSLALLDDEAGLLWTGDTFYEGPIWLFVPETDLDAYERSLERLVALAPSLTQLHPAHNTPVAEPSRLAELARAFADVRSGRVTPSPYEPGIDEYQASGFRFLLASAPR